MRSLESPIYPQNPRPIHFAMRLCIFLCIAAIVATCAGFPDFPFDRVEDGGIRKEEQLCRIGGSKLRFCSLNGGGRFLPEDVSWMRAQYATSAVPGSPVQLFGVTLVLGISDGSKWSSGAFNVSFLEQLFGHDASQEFSKQAIFLQSQDIPSMLRKMPPPLFEDFIPPYALHTDILFGSWHCVPILADGSWCSRWLSFLSAASKRGLIQSRYSSQQLHTAAASVLKLQEPPDSSFTIYRSEGAAEDIAAFCEVANPSDQELDSLNQSSSGCPTQETEVVLESLNRALVGGGSHRELHSRITLRVAGSPDPIQQDCSLVLVEYLPNSIFADAFELQRLTKRGAIQEAYVYGDLNLEKPAFYSHQSIVELQTPLFKDGNSLSADVSLPLHVRYAPLSLASYSLVNLSCPQMLVKCSSEITKQVVWGADTQEILLSSSLVHWPVPAGNISHAAFVTVWTTVTAVTGTVVLTLVAYMSSLIKLKTV